MTPKTVTITTWTQKMLPATGSNYRQIEKRNQMTQTAKTNKNAKTVSPLLVAPTTATAPLNNALTALVAKQAATNAQAASAANVAADAVTMPSVGTAVQQAAKAGFTRTVQNGRGDYTPNSIGALIWQTASALQDATPNTPVTSAAVRLALPHVKPASVSAGLSHWRKFCGTMRVKGQAPAPVVAPVVVAPVAPVAAPAKRTKAAK